MTTTLRDEPLQPVLHGQSWSQFQPSKTHLWMQNVAFLPWSVTNVILKFTDGFCYPLIGRVHVSR